MLLLGGIGDHLGHLEGAQNAPAQFQGIVEGLHARGMQRELIVAEIGLLDPGGHDQAVVGILDRLMSEGVGMHNLALEIETGHLGQLHPHVLVLAHDVTQSGGDLARREQPGRRLVEQRLEEMVVSPVDEGDIDIFPAEQARVAGRPPKPPPTITTRWR